MVQQAYPLIILSTAADPDTAAKAIDAAFPFPGG
jgi:hypothetical protein